MSSVETPEVLAREGNLAVIQLPGRHYPGLFLQGDTLATLRRLFDAVQDVGSLPGEMLEIRDRLDEFISYYESVLRGRGIRLPY